MQAKPDILLEHDRVDAPSVLGWTERGGWETIAAAPAEGVALTVYLDQVELTTLMCTPEKLKFLAAGFLRSEGVIERLNDIALSGASRSNT